MDYLPPPDERQWLLDCIADLIVRRGAAPWVTAHLVEPTPRFLPDPWTPTPLAVERVARRLLAYADLGALEAEVIDLGDCDEEAEPSGCVLPGSLPVRFERLERGRCVLTVDEAALEDTELVGAALSHAVAHAYRAHYGVVGDAARGGYRDAPIDRGAPAEQLEEWRADVTAVYLGFGVLLTNGTEKHKSSGEVRGTNASWRVEVMRVGALSPQAASYVLAAQAASRRLDARAERRVAGHLQPNQAAFFRASLKLLQGDTDALAQGLGIAEQQHWPSPPPLEELTRALPLARASEVDRAPVSRALPNRGQRVFRVPRNRATRYAMLFGSAAAALGGVVGRADPASVVSSALLGTLLGAGVGGRRRRDECSDPDCAAVLGEGEQSCPRCGGEISGVIARPEDRLAALEEIEARRKAAGRRGRR
jgi:hypothetical protein